MNILRWILLPVFVTIGFFVTGFGSAFLANNLRIWSFPIMGFLVAFVVVTISYLTAPKYKLITGTVVFVIGAIFALKLVGKAWYPENYPRPYERTFIPIICTYVGGILGLLFPTLINKVRKKSA